MKSYELSGTVAIVAAGISVIGFMLEIAVGGNCLDLGGGYVACEEGWQFNLFRMGSLMLFGGGIVFVITLVLTFIGLLLREKQEGSNKEAPR